MRAAPAPRAHAALRCRTRIDALEEPGRTSVSPNVMRNGSKKFMQLDSVDFTGDLELKGLWWPPENPNNPISGTLRVSQAEIVLEGVGVASPRGRTNIILGQTFDCSEVTLFGCLGGGSMPFSLMQSFRIPAARVVFGYHFSSIDDELYHRVDVSFDHLHLWTQESGFAYQSWLWRLPSPFMNQLRNLVRRTIGPEFLRKWSPNHKISYEFPDPIMLAETELVKIQVKQYLKPPPQPFPEGRCEVKETVVISIQSREPSSFEFFRPYIWRLQNFLSIALDYPTFPRVIKLHNNDALKPHGHLFYRFPSLPSKAPPQIPRDTLFTLPQMLNSNADALHKWIEEYERFEPVLDAFFATIHQPTMFFQNRFLQLVQALESYHRLAFSTSLHEKEEHSQRLSEIMAACPPTHKRWLTQKLAFAHEPSLKERLDELYTEYSFAFEGIIDSNETMNHIIRTIVDTRNYLTHLDVKARGRIAPLDTLYQYCSLTTYWMYFCIFTLIGLSRTQMESLAKNSFPFEGYRRIISKIKPPNKKKKD